MSLVLDDGRGRTRHADLERRGPAVAAAGELHRLRALGDFSAHHLAPAGLQSAGALAEPGVEFAQRLVQRPPERRGRAGGRTRALLPKDAERLLRCRPAAAGPGGDFTPPFLPPPPPLTTT